MSDLAVKTSRLSLAVVRVAVRAAGSKVLHARTTLAAVHDSGKPG